MLAPIWHRRLKLRLNSMVAGIGGVTAVIEDAPLSASSSRSGQVESISRCRLGVRLRTLKSAVTGSCSEAKNPMPVRTFRRSLPTSESSFVLSKIYVNRGLIAAPCREGDTMSAIVVLVSTTVIVAVSHGTGEVARRQGGAMARRLPLSRCRTPKPPG